jgi:hypothetical protein
MPIPQVAEVQGAAERVRFFWCWSCTELFAFIGATDRLAAAFAENGRGGWRVYRAIGTAQDVGSAVTAVAQVQPECESWSNLRQGMPRGLQMTEAEWLACDKPRVLVSSVRGLVSDRKLRLAGIAAVRAGRCATTEFQDTLERFADAAPTEETLAHSNVKFNSHLLRLYGNATAFAEYCVGYGPGSPPHTGSILATAVREVIAYPFCPVGVEPSWLTSDVLALASEMYESGDFSPMPILADALQDAGCDNADILDHCRGPGQHVRGCWVVDLVLGKE